MDSGWQRPVAMVEATLHSWDHWSVSAAPACRQQPGPWSRWCWPAAASTPATPAPARTASDTWHQGEWLSRYLVQNVCQESIVKHSVKREMWRVQVSSNHYNSHQSIAGPCTSGKCGDIIMGGTYAIVLWTGYYNIHATGQKEKYISLTFILHKW